MNTWHVGGVDMEYPIIVGAGVCKTPDSIDEYQNPDLPIGALVGGSYTRDGRDQNPGKPSAWIEALKIGFNSYGMPNCGAVKAADVFAKKALHHPLIASFAGFSDGDYEHGTAAFSRTSVWKKFSAIEWNLGCPNAHDKKTIPISYDYDSLYSLLQMFQYWYSHSRFVKLPIWLKLSPFIFEEDLTELGKFVDVSSVPTVSPDYTRKVADLIARYHFVFAVVNGNTIPNCRYRDAEGNLVTTPNDGQAGLSGALLKKIAFRQVVEMRRRLPLGIDVIASGGILTGDDAMDFFENGASAVQVTSLPYWHGGPKSLPRLLESERLQNFLSSH
jgi:dihydroorotate dehydrogenase